MLVTKNKKQIVNFLAWYAKTMTIVLAVVFFMSLPAILGETVQEQIKRSDQRSDLFVDGNQIPDAVGYEFNRILPLQYFNTGMHLVPVKRVEGNKGDRKFWSFAPKFSIPFIFSPLTAQAAGFTEDCSKEQCDFGLQCDAVTRTCKVAQSYECLSSEECASPHVCQNNVCAIDMGEKLGSSLELGETTRDIRDTIRMLVNIFLSFLSIAGVVMIIYGGALWMTARGNEEQIEKAKKTLIRAMIGMIIILLSWTIVSYILYLFAGTGGGAGRRGHPGPGGIPISLPQTPFQVTGIKTVCGESVAGATNPDYRKDVYLCSKVVIEFNHDLDVASVENLMGYEDKKLKIEKCDGPGAWETNNCTPLTDQSLEQEINNALYTGELDKGWIVGRRSITYKHAEVLFDSEVFYRVSVPSGSAGIKNGSGEELKKCFYNNQQACNVAGEGESYVWLFETGDETMVDTEHPFITSAYPQAQGYYSNHNAAEEDGDSNGLPDGLELSSNYPNKNVNPYDNLSVTFSEPIDPSMVNYDNIIIQKVTGLTDEEFADGVGANEILVPLETTLYSVNLDQANGKILTISDNASDDLNYLEKTAWYQIEIKDLEDLCNNIMKAQPAWRFKTNDESISAAGYPILDNACADTDVFVRFSVSMYDPNSTAASESQKCEIGYGFVSSITDLDGAGTGRDWQVGDPLDADALAKIANSEASFNDYCKLYKFEPTSVFLDLTSSPPPPPPHSITAQTHKKVEDSGSYVDFAHTWDFGVKDKGCINAPYISRIAPDEGPYGQCFTVFGRYCSDKFITGNKVLFDESDLGVAENHWSFDGDNCTIAASAPSVHQAGSWNITTADNYPVSFTINYNQTHGADPMTTPPYNFYLYTDKGEAKGPCIYGIQPSRGDIGKQVTISGDRFLPANESAGAKRVSFGEQPNTTSFSVWEMNQIKANVPVREFGDVDVLVAKVIDIPDVLPGTPQIEMLISNPWPFTITYGNDQVPHIIPNSSCQPADDVYTNPSPYSGRDDVCLNSHIKAQFDRPMHKSGLPLEGAYGGYVGRVEIFKCNQAGNETQCAGEYEAIDPANIYVAFSGTHATNHTFDISIDDDADSNNGFPLLTVNTWYKVRLRGGAGGFDGFKASTDSSAVWPEHLAAACADNACKGQFMPNDFSWEFKTGDTDTLCSIYGTNITPDSYVLDYSTYQIKDFTAQPFGHQCEALSGSDYKWKWRPTTETEPSWIANFPESFYEFSGTDSQNIAAITATGVSGRETIIAIPKNYEDRFGQIYLTVEAEDFRMLYDQYACRNNPAELQSPSPYPPAKNLTAIDNNPKCINSPIVVRFNQAVNMATVDTDSVKVFNCADGNMDEQFTCSGGWQVQQWETPSFSPIAQGFQLQWDGTDADTAFDNLESNKYYSIRLKQGAYGIKSSGGNSLNQEPDKPVATWVFKTGNEECDPDRAQVSPIETIVHTVPQDIEYTPTPIANDCQVLIDRYDWGWGISGKDEQGDDILIDFSTNPREKNYAWICQPGISPSDACNALYITSRGQKQIVRAKEPAKNDYDALEINAWITANTSSLGTANLWIGDTLCNNTEDCTTSPTGASCPDSVCQAQDPRNIKNPNTRGYCTPLLKDFSPSNGGPYDPDPVGDGSEPEKLGTFVSVQGCWFGERQGENGKVEFIRPKFSVAWLARKLPEHCDGEIKWNNEEVIVQVPEITSSEGWTGNQYVSLISLTTNNQILDWQGDAKFLDHTLLFPVFVINKDKYHPGICKITPDSGTPGTELSTPIKIKGASFNASREANEEIVFYDGQKVDVDYIDLDNWKDTEIEFNKVPEGAEPYNSTSRGYVQIIKNYDDGIPDNDDASNQKSFEIVECGQSCNTCAGSKCVLVGTRGVCTPVITSVVPAEAGQDSILTINGCMFGENRGSGGVSFVDAQIKDSPMRSANLPSHCVESGQTIIWGDEQIVTYVPKLVDVNDVEFSSPLENIDIKVKTKDGLNDTDIDAFTYNKDKKPPGICRLNPTRGAEGSTVQVLGVNFGSLSPSNKVKFDSTQVTTFITEDLQSDCPATGWDAEKICAVVPAGMLEAAGVEILDSKVTVTKGAEQSQELDFKVVAAEPTTPEDLELLRTYPVNDATDVPLDYDVRLVFNKDIANVVALMMWEHIGASDECSSIIDDWESITGAFQRDGKNVEIGLPGFGDWTADRCYKIRIPASAIQDEDELWWDSEIVLHFATIRPPEVTAYYPQGENKCLNAQIGVEFDMPMDVSTYYTSTGTIIVASCLLTQTPCEFVNEENYTIEAYAQKAVVKFNQGLLANKKYLIVLSSNKIEAANGLVLNNGSCGGMLKSGTKCSWEFTTSLNAEPCKISGINITGQKRYVDASGAAHVSNPAYALGTDIFTCAKEAGCEDDIAPYPISSGDTHEIIPGNQHYYEAQAYHQSSGEDLIRLQVQYEWNDNNIIDTIFKPDDVANSAAAYFNPDYTVSPIKEGAEIIEVKATDQLNSANIKTTDFELKLMLCEKPWPLMENVPFNDLINICEGTPDGGNAITCPDLNFSTWYCQQKDEAADILPRLTAPIRDNLSDKAEVGFAEGKMGNMLKHIVLPVIDSGDYTELGNNAENDVITITVYENPNDYSITEWCEKVKPTYRDDEGDTAEVDCPASSSGSIGGYPAFTDNTSVYISALNFNGTDKLFTNIYVLSYNINASQGTQKIFEQLLNNLKFHTNILAQTQVNALFKDRQRIEDLKLIKEKLADYYNDQNWHYPILEKGTYLRGITNSVWNSWNELGNLLHYALPQDPKIEGDDVFPLCTGAKNYCREAIRIACGTEPYPCCLDSDTQDYNEQCWKKSESDYICPVGSYIYQYEVQGDCEFHDCNETDCVDEKAACDAQSQYCLWNPKNTTCHYKGGGYKLYANFEFDYSNATPDIWCKGKEEANKCQENPICEYESDCGLRSVTQPSCAPDGEKVFDVVVE